MSGTREDGVASIRKALAVLEVVSDTGGVSARELSATLGIPLATVYRLCHELVAAGYLVHLRSEQRYELGYRVYGMASSLHRKLAAPALVRRLIDDLHEEAEMAAYLAVYRGADVVVTYVSECPRHPRLAPLRFGFNEAAHATAFGKIMLAGMEGQRRRSYLESHGLAPVTAATIPTAELLEAHLETVMLRGVAWERDEFVDGKTCAAVAVRDAAGLTVGSVAVSVDSDAIGGAAGRRAGSTEEARVERLLRDCASHVSRFFRTGETR